MGSYSLLNFAEIKRNSRCYSPTFVLQVIIRLIYTRRIANESKSVLIFEQSYLPEQICLITSANKPLRSLTTHHPFEFKFIFTFHIAIPGTTALGNRRSLETEIPSTAFTFL